MFREPWFSRAWTLQEALIAEEAILCYGSYSLSWHEFRRLHRTISKSIPSQFGSAFYRLEDLQDTYENGEMRALSSLLLYTRHRKALDQRDKVFSLVALLPKLDAYSLLSPDYTLSIKEVCIRATRSCLMADEDPSVLCFSGLPSRVNNDLPSWVVHWHDVDEFLTEAGWHRHPARYGLGIGMDSSEL